MGREFGGEADTLAPQVTDGKLEHEVEVSVKKREHGELFVVEGAM